MPVLQVLLLKIKKFLVDPRSCLQPQASDLDALWPPASNLCTHYLGPLAINGHMENPWRKKGKSFSSINFTLSDIHKYML